MSHLAGAAGLAMFLAGWLWFGWLLGGGRGALVVVALLVVVVGMIVMATAVGSRFVVAEPREGPRKNV